MEHAATHDTGPASLDGSDYVSLRTVRADGRTVGSPMWFAIHEGAVVMRTPADAPKTRRLRSNPA